MAGKWHRLVHILQYVYLCFFICLFSTLVTEKALLQLLWLKYLLFYNLHNFLVLRRGHISPVVLKFAVSFGAVITQVTPNSDTSGSDEQICPKISMYKPSVMILLLYQ